MVMIKVYRKNKETGRCGLVHNQQNPLLVPSDCEEMILGQVRKMDVENGFKMGDLVVVGNMAKYRVVRYGYRRIA